MNVRHSTQIWKFLGVALASLALLIGAAIPAAADELMRVTFIRHGESAGNASGLIDTKTPGPVLTPTGQLQAQAVADLLGDNNYDGIYASTMVRTQLTAAPMSQYLRLPIQVLPGLQEIEAGVFEGTPEANAAQGYAKIPLAWAFQGNLDVAMPGTSPKLDGHVFDARVDSALQTIYNNGDRNPVVFSHGGTIMFWTMMNAQNLDLQQKIDLLSKYALGNTDYVIVEGNPTDGWTLVNWNGQLFSPEPTFDAEVQRQVRTLTRQLAATVQQVVGAFASGDFATIATAVNRGIADATYSIVKFNRAVNAKLIKEFTPAPAPATEVSTIAPTTDTKESLTPAVTASTDTKKASPLTAAPVTDTKKVSGLTGTPATDTKKDSLLSIAPKATTKSSTDLAGLKDVDTTVTSKSDNRPALSGLPAANPAQKKSDSVDSKSAGASKSSGLGTPGATKSGAAGNAGTSSSATGNAGTGNAA